MNYLLITTNHLHLHYLVNILKNNNIEISDKYELGDSSIIFNCKNSFNELKDVFFINNNIINEIFLKPLKIGDDILMTNGIKDFLWVNSEINLDVQLTKEEIILKIKNEGIDSLTNEELDIVKR